MAEQGDLLDTKSDPPPSYLTNSLDAKRSSVKFSYPLLVEAQIRKFKQSMEPWREIALNVRSIFLWEKQWHPTAILGASTIIFTLLWLMDPSVLTIFSTLGLCVTTADYLVPSISSLFKSNKWDAEREKQFDDLCTDLVLFKVKTELACVAYYKMRTTNRKMYFLITTLTLVFLAWVGCTINNLFLGYFIVTLALLMPGLEHHGIVSKGTGALKKFLYDLTKGGSHRVTSAQKND